MTERAIRTEQLSESSDFEQTWSLAQNAFVEYSCSKPNSVASYKSDLKSLRGFLQARNIDSWKAIKPDDLFDFFERPQVKSPQKYSPTSTDRQVVVVRGFLNWIKSNTAYPVNNQIIETIRSINRNSENGRRYTPEKLLSRSELTSIAANPDSRDQALIRLIMAGIRLTQLEQLTVQDVKGDLTSPQPHLKIEVPIIKSRRDLQIEENLDEGASLALKKYLLERLEDSTNPEDPLFIHKRGPGPSKKLSRQGIWIIVTHWGEEIGIHCTPHLLAKSARLAK